MKPFPKIGDIIDAPPVQTVVRLEEGRTHSESIARSFVFTADVHAHFAVLADSLLRDHGRGFFLQGDFGSGKSHFLAALTTWLTGGSGAETLAGHHGGLRSVVESGRRFLVADISLVNYRGTTPLERIIVEAIERSIRSAGVPIRLTPLSAFLHHFSELLRDQDLAAAFAEQADLNPDRPGEIDAFIKNHPRRAYTTGIRFMKGLGMSAPEWLVKDRYETFGNALKAIRDAGFDGLVLVIDELSEFFRSKPDARGLNEDARTLQLLGELTAGQPLWIIAAVQESIEKTGDISQATFRKIKDRFPIKLALSTLHIKALISQRLVNKKPDAPEALSGIYGYLKKQFPSFLWRFEDFQAFYPVHPVTISLLDGLGELFSEHRGIVDFVHSRIAGDTGRRISGILDRPAYELLGPDSIYEHFSQRIAEFSAFHIYPRHVIPHLDEVIDRIMEDAEDRTLARRIVRVLVLYRIHPTADEPTVQALTEQVACALSGQDPALNVEYVAETILDPLVAESRFVVKRSDGGGDPLCAVYAVVTEEDPAKTLKAKIARRTAEIPPDDTRPLDLVLSELPDSPAWPGPGFRKDGLVHTVYWQQSSRNVFIAFVDRENIFLRDRIRQALSAGEVDFAVVTGIGKTHWVLEHTAVWEIPFPPDNERASILREYFAVRQIAMDLQPSNPADAPLIQAAGEVHEKLRPAAHQAALDVFYAGRFADRGITVDPVVLQMKRFGRFLEEAGSFLLEKRYPGYPEIAPRKIVPSPRIYQRLIDEFISPGSLSLQKARTRDLSDAIEGIAAPLGLVEVRSGSYIFAPDPDNHSLLADLFACIPAAGPTEISGVLRSLRTGRFGVPDEMLYFLLTALAFGGLITLMKKGRAIPLEFLRSMAVKNADAVVVGEMIGRYDRETLMNACPFLAPAGGWDAFGLRQQREAWQAVVKFRDWAQKTAGEMENRLASFEEFSAFASFDLKSLHRRIDALRALADEIKVSYAAREGLERFLTAWRGNGFTADDIDFIKRLNAFFAGQAEQFIFISHYVRHKAVDRAVRDHGGIAALKGELVDLLDQPETLVRNDDPGRLTASFERFRKSYAGYYAERHGAHYEGFRQKPLSKYARRALVLLKRLAAIEALDRPRDLDSVLKALETPAASVCKRNLHEELMRSPVCGCGFIPGETPPPARRKDPETAVERCVAEYLEILKQPGVREAVSARTFALADADPDTVRRLRTLGKLLADEQSAPAALLDVLDDITAAEISRSLSERVRIEKRRLTDLVSRLGGRRLSPNQVMEAVSRWVADPGENTVIAVESDAGIGAENGASVPEWWPMMHPDLFHGEVPGDLRGIEVLLERHYPAADLRERISRMDDDRLLNFLMRERFHTHAVRMAWQLLAERIISGKPWPQPGEIQSAHADRDLAGKIKKRLRALGNYAGFARSVFPGRLRVRMPLSDMVADSWATADLRELAHEKIREVETAGAEWLDALPPVSPIDLAQNPLVVILDGISPDVWLEITDSSGFPSDTLGLAWYRLETSPQTVPAISALFGFSEDPMEGFSALGIAYHQVKGTETGPLSRCLPPITGDKPVVIRVSLADAGAHGAYLRLSEMPAAVGRFLESELPHLQEICAEQQRPLILTTDHGLSLTRRGLSHGRGGVFERAVFRARQPV